MIMILQNLLGLNKKLFERLNLPVWPRPIPYTMGKMTKLIVLIFIFSSCPASLASYFTSYFNPRFPSIHLFHIGINFGLLEYVVQYAGVESLALSLAAVCTGEMAQQRCQCATSTHWKCSWRRFILQLVAYMLSFNSVAY